jgi:hypothetical protein
VSTMLLNAVIWIAAAAVLFVYMKRRRSRKMMP